MPPTTICRSGWNPTSRTESSWGWAPPSTRPGSTTTPPFVINILLEPFFMFTARTANTFAILCALLIPSLVYFSALVFLLVLRRQLAPRAPRLFTVLGMAFVLLMPLVHVALYRGMPDLLGVAFAFMLMALLTGYDFDHPAPARLVRPDHLHGSSDPDPPQLYVHGGDHLPVLRRPGAGIGAARTEQRRPGAVCAVRGGVGALRRASAGPHVLAHRPGGLQRPLCHLPDRRLPVGTEQPAGLPGVLPAGRAADWRFVRTV